MTLSGREIGTEGLKETGQFGFETKAQCLSVIEVESVLRSMKNNFSRLPFYQSAVSAGFPSPAENDMEEGFDLNELLIKRPSATFFLRVSGSSMINAGIHNNDILIVDRSIEPKHGRIVIAAVSGELTVKRLHIEGKKVQLIPENDAYPSINITDDIELHIWGVVTTVIHLL